MHKSNKPLLTNPLHTFAKNSFFIFLHISKSLLFRSKSVIFIVILPWAGVSPNVSITTSVTSIPS